MTHMSHYSFESVHANDFIKKEFSLTLTAGFGATELGDTEQKYKYSCFIFHERNSKIEDLFYGHKRRISLKYCSQAC